MQNAYIDKTEIDTALTTLNYLVAKIPNERNRGIYFSIIYKLETAKKNDRDDGSTHYIIHMTPSEIELWTRFLNFEMK
jgi:hypothetical protein